MTSVVVQRDVLPAISDAVIDVVSEGPDGFRAIVDPAKLRIENHGARLPKKLSISQINTYLRCPLQYYWRYVCGLKVPPASAIIFGRATHKAIEHNYKHKMKSGWDLPIADVQQAFAEEFERLAPEAQWEEGENPATVKDEGVAATAAYMKEVAPKTNPVAVEEEFELDFEGADFTFKGVVDLIDASGDIIDTKTTKRTPKLDGIDNDLQLTAYAMGYRTIFGRDESGLRMDYIVRTKTPRVLSLHAPARSEKAIRRLLKLTSRVALAIEQGLFYPQPHNFSCKPASCGFWEICQENW